MITYILELIPYKGFTAAPTDDAPSVLSVILRPHDRSYVQPYDPTINSVHDLNKDATADEDVATLPILLQVLLQLLL